MKSTCVVLDKKRSFAFIVEIETATVSFSHRVIFMQASAGRLKKYFYYLYFGLSCGDGTGVTIAA